MNAKFRRSSASTRVTVRMIFPLPFVPFFSRNSALIPYPSSALPDASRSEFPRFAARVRPSASVRSLKRMREDVGFVEVGRFVNAALLIYFRSESNSDCSAALSGRWRYMFCQFSAAC